MDLFFSGLMSLVSTPSSLLVLSLGLVGGLLFGAIPGLSGLTLATVSLPLSAYLAPSDALILFSAIYVSGVYGGAITAILFNIPGDANSAPTAFDGYPMTLQGRGPEAIGAAIVGSTIGGVSAAILLVIASQPLAYFAVRAFGPPEIFAFVLVGLAFTASITADIFRGIAAVSIGLLLASVGLDPNGEAMRFTFGSVQLASGISFVPLVLGFFGIAEIVSRIAAGRFPAPQQKRAMVSLPGRQRLWRAKGDITRSSFIGLVSGLLPGVGATLAAFLAYSQGKKWSRHRSEFGKGEEGGVLCSETANNAATGSSLIPLLALGLPGGAFAAIMLASMQMHGIQPGPLVFVTSPDLVGGVFAAMFVASLALIGLGFLEASLILRLLRLPFSVVAVSVITLSVLGTYSLRNSLLDVMVMFAAGAAGYLLRRIDISIPGVVLGVVLGGIAEAQFGRTLQLIDGNPLALLERPIAAVLLAVAAITLLTAIVRAVLPRTAGTPPDHKESAS